jgi:hypothetical protein
VGSLSLLFVFEELSLAAACWLKTKTLSLFAGPFFGPVPVHFMD